RRAASRAAWTAGKSKAIRTAMMAITTSNSISVKPCARRVFITHLRDVRSEWKGEEGPDLVTIPPPVRPPGGQRDRAQTRNQSLAVSLRPQYDFSVTS